MTDREVPIHAMEENQAGLRYAMHLVEYRLLLEPAGSRRHRALAHRLAGLSDRLDRTAGCVIAARSARD